MPDLSRPNLLLITTDQQSALALGCAGNPDLRTPALDGLAAGGTRFEAAYVANPICVPSRTSYMTGTASHENGVSTNLSPRQCELTVPCLATVFRDHGYDTGHFGKWHVPRPLDDRAWSGFETIEALRDNGIDPQIAPAAAEFIRQRRDRPYFAIASFVNPHDICEWARRLSGMENDLPNGEIGSPPPADQCPLPRPNAAIPAGEPSVIREHQHDPRNRGTYPTADWAEDDPRWRQYLWGYYRMVEAVDRQIGELLDAVRQTDDADNTIIVFTSDHGDGMGAHRWNQKTLFYDEVARVPLIISGPADRVQRAVNREHVVNIGLDLFPTLFDLAGLPTPTHLRGVSAAPCAIGRGEPSRREFIVCENNLHHGFGKPGEVHGRMVRSRRYKYICYSHGSPREQLFDLHADPMELRDLTHRDEAPDVLAAHRRMLREYTAETGDFFAAYLDELTSPGKA